MGNIESKSKKNILIITEQFTLGGLETHIHGEIIQLKKRGWSVHLACGPEYRNNFIPSSIDSVTYNLPMQSTASTGDLLQTVGQIRRIIAEKDIDILHAHPFLSIFPSYIAATISSKPLLITLHGPSSVAGVYGPYFEFINSQAFAHSTLLVVSPEIENILQKRSEESRVNVVVNSVRITNSHNRNSPIPEIGKSRWLISSRIDEDKTKGIKEFISIAIECGVQQIDIAGDGSMFLGLQEWCRLRGIGRKVNFLGFRDDVTSLIPQYDAVAGMGRVVLEAIAASRMICLVGYDGVKGIIKGSARLKTVAYHNFSGRGLDNINAAELKHQYRKFDRLDAAMLKEYVYTHYNEERTWGRFIDIAKNAVPIQDGFIEDLYGEIKNSLTTEKHSWQNSIQLRELTKRIINSEKYTDKLVKKLYNRNMPSNGTLS